jgi:hypothetical protein
MNINGKIISPDPVTGFINIVIDGKNYNIQASHPKFSDAITSIVNNDYDEFMNIVDPASKLSKLYASYEGIEVKDGSLYVFEEQVHGVIAERILGLLNIGLDCTNVFKFILKLNLNPSKRAVDELYTFLEHKNLPLTDTGNFLAYKAVRNNFTDKHTGKFLNTVDSVLEMPRNKVDDNKEVGCSYGFHAGTVEYALGFACGDDKLVLVEINPADVVSIPTDCNFQKLRTCKYKVVGEYERPLEEAIYPSRYETDNDDDVDLWGDEEEEEDLCSGCNMEYNSWCCECEQCGDCCDCGDCAVDDEDLEDAYPEPEQLSLPLDNKMQSVPWNKVKVNVEKLLNHLFKSRRPALAMAIRRDNAEFNFEEIPFGSLCNFTTDNDAKTIYDELNP